MTSSGRTRVVVTLRGRADTSTVPNLTRGQRLSGVIARLKSDAATKQAPLRARLRTLEGRAKDRRDAAVGDECRHGDGVGPSGCASWRPDPTSPASRRTPSPSPDRHADGAQHLGAGCAPDVVRRQNWAGRRRRDARHGRRHEQPRARCSLARRFQQLVRPVRPARLTCRPQRPRHDDDRPGRRRPGPRDLLRHGPRRLVDRRPRSSRTTDRRARRPSTRPFSGSSTPTTIRPPPMPAGRQRLLGPRERARMRHLPSRPTSRRCGRQGSCRSSPRANFGSSSGTSASPANYRSPSRSVRSPPPTPSGRARATGPTTCGGRTRVFPDVRRPRVVGARRRPLQRVHVRERHVGRGPARRRSPGAPGRRPPRSGCGDPRGRPPLDRPRPRHRRAGRSLRLGPRRRARREHRGRRRAGLHGRPDARVLDRGDGQRRVVRRHRVADQRYASPTSLSVSGLPAGTSATFSPNVLGAGVWSSTLSVTTTSSLAPGTYPFAVTAGGRQPDPVGGRGALGHGSTGLHPDSLADESHRPTVPDRGLRALGFLDRRLHGAGDAGRSPLPAGATSSWSINPIQTKAPQPSRSRRAAGLRAAPSGSRSPARPEGRCTPSSSRSS